jgi:hypothetical protein
VSAATTKARLSKLAADRDMTLSAFLREQLEAVADRCEQEHERSDLQVGAGATRRRPARMS